MIFVTLSDSKLKFAKKLQIGTIFNIFWQYQVIKLKMCKNKKCAKYDKFCILKIPYQGEFNYSKIFEKIFKNKVCI